MKEKKIRKSTVKWIAKRSRAALGDLIVLFIVKILQGAEGVVFAFLLRNIVDAAVAHNMAMLVSNAVYVCILIVLAIVLYWCAQYFVEKPTAKLTKHLRERAFSELLNRSYPDVVKVHTGEWMTRINSDSSVIANAITTIIPSTAGLIVQLVCAVVSLFLIMPGVAWIIVPLGAFMVALSLFLRTRLKNYHKEVQKYEGEAYSFFTESLGGMSVIRTFSKENQMADTAGEKLDKIVSARLKRARFVATCGTGIYGLVRVGYYIAVLICGIRIYDGLMTYGTMLAILQLVRQVDYPMAEVSHGLPQFFNMIASAERMMEIENLDPDHEGEPVASSEVNRFYEEELSAIGLKDACFHYDDEEDVLHGFSLQINKGDFIAFTGESGCGKSTTMNILMGLYKLNSGEAYILDCKGGEQPLTPLWRALFAYVPQENLLFSGTLREVVTFGDNKTVSEETIWQSLRIACAEDFVRELPQGLDTPLGERGSGLSEGQMQRIAIARAICSGRPILMLDESTSALDESTERMLLDNLKEMTDRTVLIITHRPAALAVCDKRVEFKHKD